MTPYRVAVTRYEPSGGSVRRAVGMAGGLEASGVRPAGAHVFIKPNIVFWTRAVPFPKWGVITTSRVVEEMVALLKDSGAGRIVIGEGIVTRDPKDAQTPAHAFEQLGYDALARKYGVEVVNLMSRPFKRVDLGDDCDLRFSTEVLDADLVVDLPVLKTHGQTVVSLGIKNLKGTLDIPSRKKCHSPDPNRDLHFWVAKLADRLPPIFTLIDGIYTIERGPAFDGRPHRRDILAASADVLSADLVGSALLGHPPEGVPHLVHAAASRGRPIDRSDIEVVGEPVEALAAHHAFDYDYARTEDGDWLPAPLVKAGIRGISYRKYDTSMCTYCTVLNGVNLAAIRAAWTGTPWDRVEVLTGKFMAPTPGMKKTILVGKCIYNAHKDHPDIAEMIPVKGCPPDPDDMVAAFHKAGIQVDPGLYRGIDHLPGFFMERYKDRPEFDEGFFRVAEEGSTGLDQRRTRP